MKAATKLVVHCTFMGVELRLFKRPSAFRESPSTWESGDRKSLSPVTVNTLDLFSLSVFYFLPYLRTHSPFPSQAFSKNFFSFILPSLTYIIVFIVSSLHFTLLENNV